MLKQQTHRFQTRAIMARTKLQRDVNKSSKLGFVHEPLKITWVAELFHKAQLVAVAEKK